jgi:hypothetical protein
MGGAEHPSTIRAPNVRFFVTREPTHSEASSMIRSASAVGLALSISLLAPAVLAQTSAGKPDGFALGLRAGYALPMGKVGKIQSTGGNTSTTDDTLSDALSGMVPIRVDAGYRINPSLYVGGFFQYGFGIINKDKSQVCNQISCSAHDMAFGANVQYHLLPAASFDPWIGAGVGYEILAIHESGSVPFGTSQIQLDVDANLKGFQFVNLEAGGDFKAAPDFAVGPFVNFAMGQYSSYSISSGGFEMSGDLAETGLHEWLTLGVRGQFNL